MSGKRFLAWVLLVAALPATADQQDTWNLIAGAGLYNDSNIFRRPDGQDSSDVISTLNAGIRINKPISLQRLVVDASVTDFRYDKNSYLNYLGKNAKVAWQWSLTPQLHGNLSKNYSEAMNSFVDYWTTTPELRKNIRTTDSTRFDFEWEAFGRLHPVAAYTHSELKNSQEFLAESNYASDAIEYGLKYVLPTGSYLSLVERQTEGEYKNRTNIGLIDSGFKQSDHELRFAWMASEKSRFTGRVAYIDRKHDHLSWRDYDGFVGGLDYTLDLTGKIRVIASLKRDLASYQSGLISYYQVDGFSITPIWQISAKTALRGRYNHDERDYRAGDISAFKDKLTQSSISLDWAPLRSMTFSATAQRDTRDSGRPGFDFKSNMLILSANFMF